MVNNIEIFNVNFGDCFICGDRNESAKMLLDFGSMRRIRRRVIDEVNAQLMSVDAKYLMITHFHNDHYSGIRHLDRRIAFDEIYLPDFFSDSVIRLQFAILAALSQSSRSYSVAYNILSVIPNLTAHVKNNSRIVFARRGEIIHNRVDTFRVLWPENANFDDIAQYLYNEIIDYYELEEKQELINGYADEYFSHLPPLREVENSVFIQFDDDNVLNNTNYIINMIDSFKDGFEKPTKRLGRRLSKKITSFQNDISLCIDNVLPNNNKPVLFLSDITLDNYYYIYNERNQMRLADYYHAIKVPHHGTKDYYVNNLPNNDYLIISNGKMSGSGWRITALYGWNYKTSRCICTNYVDACDYHLTAKQCDAYSANGCSCGIQYYYHLQI